MLDSDTFKYGKYGENPLNRVMPTPFPRLNDAVKGVYGSIAPPLTKLASFIADTLDSDAVKYGYFGDLKTPYVRNNT
jgi:hypothetical protein